MQQVYAFQWSHKTFVDSIHSPSKVRRPQDGIYSAYIYQGGYVARIINTMLVLLMVPFIFFSVLSKSETGSFMLCIGVPVMFSTLYLIAGALWYSLSGPTWKLPQLYLSGVSLYSGDRLQFQLQVPALKDIQVTGEIRLVARESVQYSCGTDTCYDQADHTIETYTIFDNLIKGRTMSIDGEFIIPENAMPTFSAKDNKIGWMLILQLATPSIKKYEQLYQVEVKR